MIFPEVCAGTQHGVVGLVLVEFLEVRAEHPDGGIEPLEGRQDIDQEYFDGVPIGDVRLLMGEDGFVRDLPVFPGQDDIFHPAERVDVPLGDENPAAVFFSDRFALTDDAEDGQDGDEHPAEDESHSCPEQDGKRNVPPGLGDLNQRGQFLFRQFGDHGGFRHEGRCRLHRLMDGDDAQRQQERQDRGSHQHHAVEPVEGFLLQQEPVEQVEYQQRDRHLGIVDQERHHFCSPFSTRSMSSLSCSTVIFSSFTRADTALR